MKSLSLYNKIFLIFVSIIIVSISLVSWFGYKSTTDAYIEVAFDKVFQNSNSIEVSIEGHLSHIPKNIIFVSNFYALKRYMVWRAMDDRAKMEKWKDVTSSAIVDFLHAQQDYYRARIIGVDGQELINIKYNRDLDTTFIIQGEALQNKSKKEYIKKTKMLQKEEIYISPIDLNMENGKIEKPYIPVIRYATPIVGSDGEVIAIFILTAYAKNLLDMIEAQANTEKSKGLSYYLINKDGEYLYHKQKNKRWSKQLNNEHNFNDEHLSIKKYFQGKVHGTFSHNHKIYSFHEVSPDAKKKEDFFYIVASVDEDIALTQLNEFGMMFFSIILGVVLLSFFIIRFFILRFTQIGRAHV